MIEKGITGGIYHVMHRYVEVTNKYMKNHDKIKKSSNLMYLDVNNFHGWAISQKLPAEGFKWEINQSRFDDIKNYDESSNKGYIFDVVIDYPKNLHDFQSDLPFLPERIKINKSNKLACNLYDK